MPTKDSEHIDAFLKEFISGLTKEFPQEIDFILLFGSAARGEFKAGISDVDLIIQLKKKQLVSKVEKSAERIFINGAIINPPLRFLIQNTKQSWQRSAPLKEKAYSASWKKK